MAAVESRLARRGGRAAAGPPPRALALLVPLLGMLASMAAGWAWTHSAVVPEAVGVQDRRGRGQRVRQREPPKPRGGMAWALA